MSVSNAAPAAGSPVRPPPAPPRKRRVRIVAESLLSLLITIVMTLGLLEIGLRLFAPQLRNAVSQDLFDPDRGGVRFRNMPGAVIDHASSGFHVTYRINAQSLRENAPTGPPPPDRVRVLNLGDSFTFGWGVTAEQAYPHLLNDHVAASGQPVESLNAGVIGYGTDDEAAWLQKYGWRLQPKIVLVGFFVGNDVTDVMEGLNRKPNPTPQEQQVIRYVEAAGQRLHPRSDLERWLKSNSHAYILLNDLYLRTVRQGRDRPPDIFDDAFNYLKPEPPELTIGWESTTAILDAMHQDAQQHGATLVVVAIPARQQLEEDYWQFLQKPLGLTEADLERDRPQRKLAEWSGRTGAPLIDLLPGFRAAHGKSLYLYGDGHFDPAGHALAAQLISEGLVRLGLFSR